jgi:hypothetical protein
MFKLRIQIYLRLPAKLSFSLSLSLSETICTQFMWAHPATRVVSSCAIGDLRNLGKQKTVKK